MTLFDWRSSSLANWHSKFWPLSLLTIVNFCNAADINALNTISTNAFSKRSEVVLFLLIFVQIKLCLKHTNDTSTGLPTKYRDDCTECILSSSLITLLILCNFKLIFFTLGRRLHLILEYLKSFKSSLLPHSLWETLYRCVIM